MNQQLFDLSDFFISKSQSREFIQGLNNIIDQIYEVNFNLEVSLTKEFGIGRKDKFITLLRENQIDHTSNDAIKKFLTSIQEAVEKIPILSLTIAFDPNEESLKSISQWFLVTLNKQILVDIKVDRKLIAGAVINFNGKFKDYSIKPMFDEIVSQTLSHNIANQANNIISHQSTQFMSVGR